MLVLYLGASATGWLVESDKLAMKSNPASHRGPEAKLDYLKRYIQKLGQPLSSITACHVLLDFCAETIVFHDTQRHLTKPYTSHRALPASIDPGAGAAPAAQQADKHSTGEGNEIGMDARAQRKLSHHLQLQHSENDELSAIRRLTPSVGGNGRSWIQERFKAQSGTVRQVVCHKQAETLEWVDVLTRELDCPVRVLSCSLLIEFNLQKSRWLNHTLLVVNTQPDGSTRHLFFKDGWLQFSRLLRETTSGSAKQDAQSSIESTQLHLQNALAIDEEYSVKRLLISGTSIGDSESAVSGESTVAIGPIIPIFESLLNHSSDESHDNWFGIRRSPELFKKVTLETTAARSRHRVARQQQLRQHVSGFAGAVCTAGILTVSVYQLVQAGLLVNKKFEVQRFIDLNPETLQADNHGAIPADGLKRIVEFWHALQEQSSLQPVAVLLLIDELVAEYPSLVLTKVGWRYPVAGTQQFQEVLAFAATEANPYSKVDPAASTPTTTLEISIEGFVDTTSSITESGSEQRTLGKRVSYQRWLSTYEDFLADIRSAFSLELFDKTGYPFGADPLARRSSGGSDKYAAGESASRKQMHKSPDNRFSLTFTVTESVLRDISLTVSKLVPDFQYEPARVGEQSPVNKLIRERNDA